MRHRRRVAIHASERANVLDVEQQPPVPGTSELVELHEARLDVGAIRVRDQPQRIRARGGVLELPRRVLLLTLDVRDFLDLDLAFELELPQLDEELALLRDERFGLALQRADALGGALGGCLWFASRSLCADRCDERGTHEHRPDTAHAPTTVVTMSTKDTKNRTNVECLRGHRALRV